MDKMDMALDDLIDTKRKASKSAGNRQSSGNNRGVAKKVNIKRRNAPYNPPSKGNVNKEWKHDLFPGDLRSKLSGDLRSTLSNSSSQQSRRGDARKIIASGALKALKQQSPLSIKGKAGIALEITNLDPRATEADVKTIMSGFGRVIDCKLKLEAGRSKGCACVSFAQRQSGLDAINQLNGQVADGRKLNVREINSGFSIAGVAEPIQKPEKQSYEGGLYADRMETMDVAPRDGLFQRAVAATNDNRNSRRQVSKSNNNGRQVTRNNRNTTFSVTI